MVNLYSVGVNRIFYKSTNFVAGKTITAYLWSPTMVKSVLQSLTEIELGLYYLDYNFIVAGNYIGLFYEDSIPVTFSTFRINVIESKIDSVQDDTDFIKVCIENKKYIVKIGSSWYLKIKDADDNVDIVSKILKDKHGDDILDIHSGILAQELKSDV